jgi:hypothetical protein
MAHTGYSEEDRVPRRLVEAVEELKSSLLDVDRKLHDNKLSAETAQQQVNRTCDSLIGALEEHIRAETVLEKAIGAYVFRETFPFFMLSTIVDRSFSKPRGYAGDYFTIEMIYRNEPKGHGRLGPYIDRWFLDRPAGRAVRNRRGLLAATIEERAARWAGPGSMPVTTLASGPARELFDVFAAQPDANILATCIDIDNEALAFAANLAAEKKVADRMHFARENVVRLAQGKVKMTLPPQNLIYSIGLIDYLQDDLVVALIDWAFDHLLPGGTLVVGNFDSSNPDKILMDHILEWPLIHRSSEALQDLFARSRFGGAAVRVQLEAANVNLFAFCDRPAHLAV